MDCLQVRSTRRQHGSILTECAAQRFPGFSGDRWAAQLLLPAQPMIEAGFRRLIAHANAAVQQSSAVLIDVEHYASDWFASMYGRLLTMMARTVVLEMHVTRVESGLDGETPEERFATFCTRLGQASSTEPFFAEYQVLEQQVEQLIEQTIEAAVECLERLVDDAPQLTAQWCSTSESIIPRLIRVDADRSDRHRGGRRVVILEFDTGWRLVYKPRSLAIDVQWGDLVEWFNARGTHPTLALPKVLNRGDYGWCEYMAHATCTTPSEVERFYARLGAYVALLYVIQATDFHSENVIAVGEHPMLIDLESLLAPQQDAFGGTEGVDRAAGQAFTNSVLRAGILPHGIWAYGDSEGIDISAMGTVAGKQTPFRVPYFVDPGTDRMRLDRDYRPMIAAQNQPTLRGERVDPLAYRASLHEGFRQAYETLRQHRDELLDDEGPLARCAHCEVRVLLRLTQTYTSLYDESFHPDLLRDEDDRANHFGRLAFEVGRNSSLADVLLSETRDLGTGNIPRFTTTPASRDLWTSDRQQVIDFYPESGLAAAQACLRGLGDDDFAAPTMADGCVSFHDGAANGRDAIGHFLRDTTHARPYNPSCAR